ncbi:hypothetical protein GCM10009665_25290 [Kitasatospora nipponensis]|uniref:Uncharacterized protein n=1 Tax=Kitasatospora nipponensis TaxID=258049 RepID=A0ABN1W6T8_9ACTN
MRAFDLDPIGERHGGTPTYPWRKGPARTLLATRRQLREMGLSGVRAGSLEGLEARIGACQQATGGILALRKPRGILAITAKGRLTVRRPGIRHVVYLDEVTHGLAADWLRERHRRWPFSSNPHLIVNQITAMDANGPGTSRGTIKNIFEQLGLNPRQVRIDRIFHEAQLTADPLHLIRLFGISEVTAVRYVQAAHPERTAKPLR